MQYHCDLMKGDIWTQRESNVEMKAQIRTMLLQAKECQRLPVNPHKPRGELDQVAPQALRRNPPCSL